MTKADFITQLAQRTGLSKKAAGGALDAALDIIVDTCKKQEKLTFAGFGTFNVRQTKPSQRVNPKTKQRIQVPAKRVPRFKAGKEFKRAISQ